MIGLAHLTTPIAKATAGAVALVGLYGGYRLIGWALDRHALSDPAKCPGARRDCPPVSGKTPNPTGGSPIPGRASAPDYTWCHRVEKDQTAGMIAFHVTGDAGRYREIIAANPHKPTSVNSTGEFNFTPGSLCTGERLDIPLSWNPWIDQTGEARGVQSPGSKIPFPPYDTAGSFGLPSLSSIAGLGRGIRGLTKRWQRG